MTSNKYDVCEGDRFADQEDAVRFPLCLLDELPGVPLITSVQGQKPAACDSFIELLDLFPTWARKFALPLAQPTKLSGVPVGWLR